MEECDVIIVPSTGSPLGGSENGVITSIIKTFILPGKINLFYDACFKKSRA